MTCFNYEYNSTVLLFLPTTLDASLNPRLNPLPLLLNLIQQPLLNPPFLLDKTITTTATPFLCCLLFFLRKTLLIGAILIVRAKDPVPPPKRRRVVIRERHVVEVVV